MMVSTRILELGASALLVYPIFDQARVLAYGLLLRRMRERHPEMFDSQLALANINGAIEQGLIDCAHTVQSGQLRRAANGYAGFLICDYCGADVLEQCHAPASEPPRPGPVSPSRST